jgi:Txe/YoeB family toxin of Txe-Axe toxin-antitoxin module
MVDLVWIVKEKNEQLLGASWGTYSRRIIEPNYRIKKPIFGTYDDLEEILRVAFQMFEDFKIALMNVKV